MRWLPGVVVVVAGCEVPSQNEPSREPVSTAQAAGVDCQLIAKTYKPIGC